MSSADDTKPLLGTFSVGSPMDAFLRKALATLKEEADSSQTRELLDDVLAGKRSMRELADSQWFRHRLAAVDTNAVLNAQREAAEYAKRYGDLTDELARGESA